MKASRLARNEEDNDEKTLREEEAKAMNDLTATVKGMVEAKYRAKNTRFKLDRLRK